MLIYFIKILLIIKIVNNVIINIKIYGLKVMYFALNVRVVIILIQGIVLWKHVCIVLLLNLKDIVAIAQVNKLKKKNLFKSKINNKKFNIFF